MLIVRVIHQEQVLLDWIYLGQPEKMERLMKKPLHDNWEDSHLTFQGTPPQAHYYISTEEELDIHFQGLSPSSAPSVPWSILNPSVGSRVVIPQASSSSLNSFCWSWPLPLEKGTRSGHNVRLMDGSLSIDQVPSKNTESVCGNLLVLWKRTKTKLVLSSKDMVDG